MFIFYSPANVVDHCLKEKIHGCTKFMESVFKRKGAVQRNMARYICIHLKRRFYSEGGGLCAEIRQEASEPPIEAATPCNLLEIRVYIPNNTESAVLSVYVLCYL